MSSELKAGTLDDRRRLVLPECFPAGCAVLVSQVDEETLVVRRARRGKVLTLVVLQEAESADELKRSSGTGPAGS